MKRDTIGKISSELKKKQADDTHSAHEQMSEQLSEWESNIFQCITDNRSIYPHDFYIIVLTKKERLMDNVLRNYYFARSTCPTPEYDQAVFLYHRKTDQIQFLWVIPSKDTCQFFVQNSVNLSPEEEQLLTFVWKFYNGDLLRQAQQCNGEVIE